MLATRTTTVIALTAGALFSSEIDTADERYWDMAKEDLGDPISDDDWAAIDTDFAEIDTNDYWEDDVDVDIDALDFADNLDIDADGDLDLGDELDLAEGFDVADFEIDADTYDLGGFDDFSGYDGVDVGDFGGDDLGDGFLGGDDAGDFDGGYLGDDDFGDFGGFDDFDF